MISRVVKLTNRL